MRRKCIEYLPPTDNLSDMVAGFRQQYRRKQGVHLVVLGQQHTETVTRRTFSRRVNLYRASVLQNSQRLRLRDLERNRHVESASETGLTLDPDATTHQSSKLCDN